MSRKAPPLRLLMMLAVLGCASSCASRVVIQTPTPPVADLHRRAEPPVPVAALKPGKEGEDAANAWNDQVLIWGRTGWAQVGRLCQWAVDMHAPGVTSETCTPQP